MERVHELKWKKTATEPGQPPHQQEPDAENGAAMRTRQRAFIRTAGASAVPGVPEKVRSRRRSAARSTGQPHKRPRWTGMIRRPHTTDVKSGAIRYNRDTKQ